MSSNKICLLASCHVILKESMFQRIKDIHPYKSKSLVYPAFTHIQHLLQIILFLVGFIVFFFDQ